MQAKQVKLNHVYLKTVSTKKTLVRITYIYTDGKHFKGVNLKTSREISVHSARGLTELTDDEIREWKTRLGIS